MPTDIPDPHSSHDFDPDKTLFFQRRKKVRLGPLIVVCVLVLGSLGLLVWALTSPDKKPVEEITRSSFGDKVTSTPQFAPARRPDQSLADVPRALPVNTPAPFDPAKPVRAALPVNSSEAAPSSDADSADAPPVVPDANGPLDFDVKNPDNAQVRAEVLRRIDLMPGVSAATKDKLYASVDHARGMGRVLTIPFIKGEAVVRPADVDRLRQQLESPQIKGMLDDPTVVFVILGYADPKGSDKVNAEVSLSRARSVLDALRDKAGIQNVMHAVAMGGSTLFSTQQAAKNRVVEVWAVLP